MDDRRAPQLTVEMPAWLGGDDSLRYETASGRQACSRRSRSYREGQAREPPTGTANLCRICGPALPGFLSRDTHPRAMHPPNRYPQASISIPYTVPRHYRAYLTTGRASSGPLFEVHQPGPSLGAATSSVSAVAASPSLRPQFFSMYTSHVARRAPRSVYDTRFPTSIIQH